MFWARMDPLVTDMLANARQRYSPLGILQAALCIQRFCMGRGIVTGKRSIIKRLLQFLVQKVSFDRHGLPLDVD